jgi:hypothetical protein
MSEILVESSFAVPHSSPAQSLHDEIDAVRFKFCPKERLACDPDMPVQSWTFDHIADQIWAMRADFRSALRSLACNNKPIDKPGITPDEHTSAKRYEWITAVNLTTDFSLGDNMDGVKKRMKQLSDFAEKTKGTSVALVVQAAFPDGNGNAAGDSTTKDPKATYHLDRYFISDGTIQKIGSVPSAGYAKDLESLLTLTCKNYNCTKLALIVDSHGQGNEGLSGDTGKVTLKEFQQTLANGLKNRTDSKIDVLNFDCCLMAQDGMVRMVSPHAKEIVASTSKIMTDGQNLVRTLEHLAKNPKIGPSDLADSFVTTARLEAAGPKEQDRWTAVRTLAHFKTDNYTEFQKELDKFGDQLCKALDSKEARKSIGAVIDSTRRYNDWGDSAGEWDTGNTADIKDFLRRTGKALEKGEIKDSDGQLKQALDATNAKFNALVVSYFGDYHQNDFDKCGGLSTYLPKPSIRDHESGGRQRTETGLLLNQGTRCLKGYKTDAQRTTLVSDTKECVDSLNAALKGNVEADKLGKGVNQAFDKMIASKTDVEFRKAANDLVAASIELQQTPWGIAKLEAAKRQLKKEADTLYSGQLVTSTNGWGRFQLKLRDGAR